MTVVTNIDLCPVFGTARNQGSRPTCTAFACSDLHAASRQPWEPLSCEYAFHQAVNRQGTSPQGGVYLHHVLDVIQHDGQPFEKAWPYLPTLPANLTEWVPPTPLGTMFHGVGQHFNADLSAVKVELSSNRPALIVMTISDAFYMPNSDGVIDSVEPVDSSRVHALIAVGHGVQQNHQLILVRNSWGKGWGLEGYAWLSERYLAPRLQQYATIKKAI